MGSLILQYVGLSRFSQLRFPSFGFVCSSEQVSVSRRKVLDKVNGELAEGDEKAALSIAKDLQGKPGGLCCFGAVRQVPRRLYTLDEPKLNGIETTSLLSPVDATLGAME